MRRYVDGVIGRCSDLVMPGSSTKPLPRLPYGAEFAAAVWCFLLAAAAGVVMRFALAGVPLPEHIDFSNLRRAHSHLMLFAWVTPALLSLIAVHAAPSRLARWAIRGALVLGLGSFMPFLLWGYQSPISIVVSTLNMFAWYAFAAAWPRMRGDATRLVGRLPVLCWDLALAWLVVGSLGAWARGAFIGMKVDDPLLTGGSVEFFLSTFTDGFLVLGVLGLLLTRVDLAAAASRAIVVVAVAVGFEFLAFLPIEVVPPALRSVGSAAVIVGGGAAAWVAVSMARRATAEAAGAERVAAALLGLLAVGKMLLASPALSSWAIDAGLRIPYLHVALLGFVSLSLFTYGAQTWPAAVGRGWIAPAIAAALVALWPSTALWPAGVDRSTALFVGATLSAAPAVVALWMITRRSPRAVKPQNPLLPPPPLDPMIPSFPLQHPNER